MFPKNVFPETSEIDSHGQLVIGGCNTLDLAAEFGTPVYVIDELTVRNRCREFVKQFSSIYPNSKVLYASKAYINPALAKIFQEEGLGLDVVSGGEFAVAKAAGFPLQEVYFHGNNKTPDELTQSLQGGTGRVVVDIFHELVILKMS